MKSIKCQMKTPYFIAKSNAINWELGLDDKYNEEQVLSIMGMLAYMENMERGFGHRNDQQLYESERNEDVDDKLFMEACIGFEFFKKCILLRKQMKM